MHELAGAFLFGMPFLSTMESWWRGNTAGPPRMLGALLISLVAIVLGYLHLLGMVGARSRLTGDDHKKSVVQLLDK